MNWYQYIASVVGIGCIKGGGTIAAAVTLAVWYFLVPSSSLMQFAITVIVFIGGVLVANKVELLWGKDNSKVVIDEVLGMMVSLLFLPKTVGVLIVAFVLFRVFDIAKPLGIRRLEVLPRGWGVMADDLLAGVYTNLVVMLSMTIIRNIA